MSAQEYADKVRASWLGQIVGNIDGLGHEFRSIDEPGPDDFPYGHGVSLERVEEVAGADDAPPDLLPGLLHRDVYSVTWCDFTCFMIFRNVSTQYTSGLSARCCSNSSCASTETGRWSPPMP